MDTFCGQLKCFAASVERGKLVAPMEDGVTNATITEGAWKVGTDVR
jgi:hypothetical protein